MKNLIALLISGALVASGYSQTRNVLVGTNNAVVQPTNFWSADASNARIGLGLGPTNSPQLNRIIVSNGSAASPAIQVGTNAKGLFGMGSVLFLAAGGNSTVGVSSSTLSVSGDIAVTESGKTRTNLGLPWSGLTNADASSFGAALGLGTAATNASTAFQPSSATLSNLANGSLAVSNIVGVIPISSGGTGATNITNARNNLGATTVGTAVFTAANEVTARTSLGASTIGGNVFTATYPLGSTGFFRINADNTVSTISASDFRSSLSLGTAATSAATAFQPSSSSLTNLATNNGSGLTNIPFTNIVGTLSVEQGGSGATTANGARTNLGLGETNNVIFATLRSTQVASSGIFNLTFGQTNTGFRGVGAGPSDFGYFRDGTSIWYVLSTNLTIGQGIAFATTAAAATTRTNLGLGWTALTNTDATNFRNAIGLGATWLTNTDATNFRNAIGLGATWLTNANASNFRTEIGLGAAGDVTFSSVSAGQFEAGNGTNTVSVEGLGIAFFGNSAATTRTNLGLPWSGLTNTNSSTFQASLFGSNTNPVLVNTNGEVVSPTNFWQVAPISTTVQYQTNITGTSTNAATNSRNLFLFSLSPSVSGITNTVTLPTNPATTFEGDRATITHLAQTTNTVTAVRQLGAATNLITLNQLDETVLLMYRSGAWRLADNISYIEPIYFSGTNASANAAASRTNLGLGVGDNVQFNQIVADSIGEINDQSYITFDGSFLRLYADDTVAVDSTSSFNFLAQFETNIVVNGFVNFSTNHTNTTPATNNQIQKFLQIRIGTNAFFLPLYK
jgi:hypothetical protein